MRFVLSLAPRSPPPPQPKIIDSVCIGNVSQTSACTPYLARHVGLRSGVPEEVPALTVNRLCGSGFQVRLLRRFPPLSSPARSQAHGLHCVRSDPLGRGGCAHKRRLAPPPPPCVSSPQSIVNACQELLSGDSTVALTGGSESMSQAPYSVRGARWGTKVGQDLAMKDTIFETLTDAYTKLPMALTAEKLAAKYGITREQCDALALRSQQTWAAAQEANLFAAEMAPITLKDKKKGEFLMAIDEHPKPKTTMEALAKLPSIFQKDGVVTAGNASGISDGAGVNIVASGEAVSRHGLKPLSRVVAYSVVGVDPTIMGFGRFQHSPTDAMFAKVERD